MAAKFFLLYPYLVLVSSKLILEMMIRLIKFPEIKILKSVRYYSHSYLLKNIHVQIVHVAIYRISVTGGNINTNRYSQNTQARQNTTTSIQSEIRYVTGNKRIFVNMKLKSEDIYSVILNYRKENKTRDFQQSRVLVTSFTLTILSMIKHHLVRSECH
jgi:hypothetical protein